MFLSGQLKNGTNFSFILQNKRISEAHVCKITFFKLFFFIPFFQLIDFDIDFYIFNLLPEFQSENSNFKIHTASKFNCISMIRFKSHFLVDEHKSCIRMDKKNNKKMYIEK